MKTWPHVTADSSQNSNPYQKCRNLLLLRTVKRMCSWYDSNLEGRGHGLEQHLNKRLTSRAADPSVGQLSIRGFPSEVEKKRKSHSLYKHILYFVSHEESKPYTG